MNSHRHISHVSILEFMEREEFRAVPDIIKNGSQRLNFQQFNFDDKGEPGTPRVYYMCVSRRENFINL